jgi:hypothetical protein
MRLRHFLILFVLACQPVFADDTGPGLLPDYMRYAEDTDSARLEVAIRSFRMPSGQQVDLIGVVHIADDVYYQKLNQRFDRYDSVLFELVGDPRRLTETAPQVLRQQYDQAYRNEFSMSALQIAV